MSGMGAEHIEVAIKESLLGVDSGDKRVGIAIKPKDRVAAEPVCVLENSTNIYSRIFDLVKENNIDTVVVGLPRDINGNETAQTRKARHFAGELADKTDLHIVLHDEFATSERARQKLGKVTRNQEKSQLDAAAAAVLLDDYMESMV
jgi:putative Holliday junction resolvase